MTTEPASILDAPWIYYRNYTTYATVDDGNCTDAPPCPDSNGDGSIGALEITDLLVYYKHRWRWMWNLESHCLQLNWVWIPVPCPEQIAETKDVCIHRRSTLIQVPSPTMALVSGQVAQIRRHRTINHLQTWTTAPASRPFAGTLTSTEVWAFKTFWTCCCSSTPNAGRNNQNLRLALSNGGAFFGRRPFLFWRFWGREGFRTRWLARPGVRRPWRREGGSSGAQGAEGLSGPNGHGEVLAHAGDALSAGAPKNRGGPRAGGCRSALQGKPRGNPAGESGVFPQQRQSNQAVCSDQNPPIQCRGTSLSRVNREAVPKVLLKAAPHSMNFR